MEMRLKPEVLRWNCDPDKLGIETTADAECCGEIIGQKRALEAISIGLEIKSHGYNIYVSGLTGTGKTTTVKKLLEQIDSINHIPDDICYVNNFTDGNAPRVLVFKAGDGKKFAREMELFVQSLRKYIPQLFRSEEYKHQKNAILDKYKQQAQKSLAAFAKKLEKSGMALVQIQSETAAMPEIFPVIDNEAVPWQKVMEMIKENKISEEEFKEFREKHSKYMEELQQIAAVQHEIEKEIIEELIKTQQDTAAPAVKANIKKIKSKYKNKKVNDYLDEAADHMIHHLDAFKGEEEDQNIKQIDKHKIQESDPFLVYRVNVAVDHSKTEKTPVITEKTPNYSNLFGTIERIWHPAGLWQTDFTKIRAGSLLRANGGYLVFNLIEAIAEPGVWNALKRALKNQQLSIQSLESMAGFASSALKPEPVEIDLKVVVIGDEQTYRMIYEMDDEFKKIFKIRADFDTVMPYTDKAVKDYIRFARKITVEEKLKDVDKTGMAAVLEYSVLLSGRRKKLSTRFSDVADIIREADYWAGKAGSGLIGSQHVDKAIEEKEYRLKTVEEKIQEMIDEGSILLNIDGSRTGQVNGLSVYSLGDYAFGRPSRITAETAVGKEGIINIEREAGLSGSSHNKGVMIIAGYLRRMYAQDKPLTMSASICFEQSYAGVDGDSASSTEIYALLSSLSGVPLRQDIAVTGSVNQKGEIQPIGGVNQKIHGFFDVCRSRGLTGSQGVMIPKTNVDDLMLRKDAVKAVEEGKFHIWAVETIDQGIALLTGMKAGARAEDGSFPKDSIHGLVNEKLAQFAERIRVFGQSAG